MDSGNTALLVPGVLVRLFYSKNLFYGKNLFSRAIILLAACISGAQVAAAESVCAEVKIQISQKVTLERQAFEAVLKIRNGLDALSVKNLHVTLDFRDASGNPVGASTETESGSGIVFFYRLDDEVGIDSGTVLPLTEAEIHWLIIPTSVAGGSQPAGTNYQIGASIDYDIGTELGKHVDVIPETVTVRPQPLLKLEYFLPGYVYADDPSTPDVAEPGVPFTLGVRISNVGYGPANHTKIESAQPTIKENEQGLLIDFLIMDSFVDNQPAQPSLTLDFGDIGPGHARMGRWIMQTSLPGEFFDFEASFTHADELGGALTSLLVDPIDTYNLTHDVIVDRPGRDAVPDFLAQAAGTATQDTDNYHVYESDGPVTLVTRKFNLGPNLEFAPEQDGTFVYARASISGYTQGTPVSATRQDGSAVNPANIWFSKRRNPAGDGWVYFLNLFEANSSACEGTCRYTVSTNGIAESASLSGVVYLDANGNGTQDPGEDGLEGFAVTLANGQTQSARESGQGGTFQFNDLAPGNYNLAPGASPDLNPGLHEIGSAGGTVTSVGIQGISLVSGGFASGYRLAMVPVGVATTADLSVSDLATGNSDPEIDEVFTVSISVANSGPAPASAHVSFNLPGSGLDVVGASASSGAFDSTTGIWTIGALSALESQSLSLQVRAHEAVDFLLSAQIEADSIGSFDPNASNNASTLPIHVGPPASADLQVELKRETRMLVLVGCLQRLPEPCAPERPSVVGTYLAAANVEHIVTTRPLDFAKELRSGHWNTYWMDGGIAAADEEQGGGGLDASGSGPKMGSVESTAGGLSDDVLAELRAAVLRGDSLWIDGTQDVQSETIEAWAGLDYLGQRTTKSEAATFDPDFTEDYVLALAGGKPNYVVTMPVDLLATYPDGAPAISRNALGEGHVFVFAFDLLSTLADDGSLDSLFGLLSETSRPELPELFMAGSYVPISMRVDNTGPAISILQTFDSPSESAVITTSPQADASSTSNHVVWTAPLAVESSFGSSAGVRLPLTSGTHDFGVHIAQEGLTSPTLAEQTVSVDVREASRQYRDVANAIAGTIYVPGPDEDARQAAETALENSRLARLDGRTADALVALLEADGQLASIAADMTSTRVELARLLQVIEREWYLALTPCDFSPTTVINDDGMSFVPAGELQGVQVVVDPVSGELRLGRDVGDPFSGGPSYVAAPYAFAPEHSYGWSFSLDVDGNASFGIQDGLSVSMISYPPPEDPSDVLSPPRNAIEVTVEVEPLLTFGMLPPITIAADEINGLEWGSSVSAAFGETHTIYAYLEGMASGMSASGTIGFAHLQPGQSAQFRIRPGSLACKLPVR